VTDEQAPLPEERRLRFERALRARAGLSLEGAHVLGAGYATQAWLLADGETVARIPRSDWGAHSLERETALLPLLENAGLPARTPRGARGVRDAEGFTGALHRLVPGAELAERLGRIDARASAAIGHDLGQFLSALHAFPPGPWEPVGLDPWPKEFARWAEALGPHLAARERAWVETRLERLAELVPPDGAPEVLTHGDLWRHHILLDDDDRLAGVIDFGLAAPGDPAWDLRFLAPGSNIVSGLGPSFASALLEAYDRPLDAAALERAEVYSDLDQVGDAGFEVTILGAPGRFLADLRASIAHGGG
jgi:aminoglycoside phosphotransferase (APT) family kinase protein